MLQNRIVWALLLALSVAPFSARGESGTASVEPLAFGVVPQQAASKLARTWVPLLRHLSAATGVEIRFKTAPDIPTFERRVADGEYDIAYMNPYHYVVFSKQPGYRAFAKQADKKIVGILVSRNDSSVDSIDALNGKTLAFPSPAAFAATILPQAYLKQQGINITPKYVSSHDSVYRNVAQGFYPAGGGITRTLKATEPQVQAQLRVLWRSPGYTPHAFAAHPELSEQTVKRVQEAMVAMASDEQGRELLGTIQFKGVTTARDSDWDDVRALDIDLLSGNDKP